MARKDAGSLFPQTAAAMGGKARAAKLTKEQRSEGARLAAESRWAAVGKLLPKATHAGVLPIGNAEIQCYVLEDGTRILSTRGIMKSLGRRWRGRKYRGTELPVFLEANNLKPFLGNEMAAVSSAVLFRTERGTVAEGFKAEILPAVCDVYLTARRADALTSKQMVIADQCEVLVRALSRVGITALVDEATGYQDVRDRLALQKILDAYLSHELAAWAKRFPDEFYREIFRLRSWVWPSLKGKGPRIVAKYTNDIVYSRLAPGILEELQKRNPLEGGRRAAKHHQLLTLDVGHPHLAAHLHAVMGLMRASTSWELFKVGLERAFPRRTDLADLPLFSPPLAAIGSGH